MLRVIEEPHFTQHSNGFSVLYPRENFGVPESENTTAINWLEQYRYSIFRKSYALRIVKGVPQEEREFTRHSTFFVYSNTLSTMLREDLWLLSLANGYCNELLEHYQQLVGTVGEDPRSNLSPKLKYIRTDILSYLARRYGQNHSLHIFTNILEDSSYFQAVRPK